MAKKPIGTIEMDEETLEMQRHHTAKEQRRRYSQTDWKFLGQEVPSLRRQKSFGKLTRFMMENKYTPRAKRIYVKEIYMSLRRYYQFMDEADQEFFWLLLGRRSKHKVITQDQFNAFKAMGVKFYQAETPL